MKTKCTNYYSIYEIVLVHVELDDGIHDDGVGKCKDQVLQIGKKKERRKMGSRQRYMIESFLFRQLRHHRGCSWV